MWVISALCELRELHLALMVCLKSHIISLLSLIDALCLGFCLDDLSGESVLEKQKNRTGDFKYYRSHMDAVFLSLY